jgi:hypothetical protein
MQAWMVNKLLLVKSTLKQDAVMFKSLLVRNPFALKMLHFTVSNSSANPATSNFSIPPSSTIIDLLVSWVKDP